MNSVSTLDRRRPWVSAGLLMMVVLPCLSPPAAAEPLFDQTNLVTNRQAANPAQITDPNLVNAWGISMSSGSPFWVSDNGTGVATLYNVNPNTNATTISSLVVTIPPVGTGTPTGQVFNTNSAGAFTPTGGLFAIGGAGKDSITVDTKLKNPAYLVGGAGDEKIRAECRQEKRHTKQEGRQDGGADKTNKVPAAQ